MMNLWVRQIMVGIGIAWLCLACRAAFAQGLGLSGGVSASQIVSGEEITYTLRLTNLTGLSIANTYVTNRFSGGISFVTGSNSLSPTEISGVNPITLSGNTVLFRSDNMTNNAVAILTLNLTPTSTGSFTNTVTGFAFTGWATNTVTTPTNLITQVFSGQSELALTLTNATGGLYSNDWTAIGLRVSNSGPDTATGVVVSNNLPSSFKLLSSVPSSLLNAFTNGAMKFNIGSLASGASTQLVVRVQPTNTGDLAVTASVSATSNLETNQTNNSASNVVAVLPFPESALAVTDIGAQTFNPGTGLMDQSLRVVNLAATNVTAFRVNVSGLGTSNRLVVASGTNDGRPFVQHNAPLAPAAGVDLWMEYFAPLRTAITGLGFEPVAVVASSLSPATNLSNLGTDASFKLTGRKLASGAFLIEFPAATNRFYTIIYSDNPAFTNAVASQPPITSSASVRQWIDSGPPRTLSHPTNNTARFYRVLRTQ